MNRSTGILTVLALSLLLRADSCTTTDVDVDVVNNFSLSRDFDVVNDQTIITTVVDSFDVGGAVRDALLALDHEGPVDTVTVVGMKAWFTRNAGLDTTRALTARVVERVEGGPDTRVPLLTTDLRTQQSPDTKVGRETIIFLAAEAIESEFMVRLQPAGSQAMQAVVDAAFAQYAATGDPDAVETRWLVVETVWSLAHAIVPQQGPRPAGVAGDDFTWRLRLNFQIVQRRQVGVYNP